MNECDPTRPGQMPSKSFVKVVGLGVAFLFAIYVFFGPALRKDGDGRAPAAGQHEAAIDRARSFPTMPVRIEIDDATTCSQTIRLFDAGDKPAIVQIAQYIDRVMRQSEQESLARGQRPVIAKLSTEGYKKLRVSAIEGCRERPSDTLRFTAKDMIAGVRQMGTDLGLPN